jgi:hypothetical protein
MRLRPVSGRGPRIRLSRIGAGLLLGLMGSSTALAVGDPWAGQTVFTSRCAECHPTTLGEKRIGPSLAGGPGARAAQFRRQARWLHDQDVRQSRQRSAECHRLSQYAPEMSCVPIAGP